MALKGLSITAPPDTGTFYILMVLRPGQDTPSALGWDVDKDLVEAHADAIIRTEPKLRAFVAQVVSELRAATSVNIRDTATDDLRKFSPKVLDPAIIDTPRTR